jgi:hypothetical protein
MPCLNPSTYAYPIPNKISDIASLERKLMLVFDAKKCCLPMLMSSLLDYYVAAGDSRPMLSSISTTCSIITCIPPNFPVPSSSYWTPNGWKSKSYIFCAEMCVVIIARSVVSLSSSHISMLGMGWWTVGSQVNGRFANSNIEVACPSTSFTSVEEAVASNSLSATLPFSSTGSAGAFISASTICAVPNVEMEDVATFDSFATTFSALVLDESVSITQRRIKTDSTASMLQQRRKIQAGSPCRTKRTVRLVIVVVKVRRQLRRERRATVRRNGLCAWLWIQMSELRG